MIVMIVAIFAAIIVIGSAATKMSTWQLQFVRSTGFCGVCLDYVGR